MSELRRQAKEIAEHIDREWYGAAQGVDWIYSRLVRVDNAARARVEPWHVHREKQEYQRGLVDALRAVIAGRDKGGTLLPYSVKLADLADAIEREGVEKVRDWLEGQR